MLGKYLSDIKNLESTHFFKDMILILKSPIQISYIMVRPDCTKCFANDSKYNSVNFHLTCFVLFHFLNL